MTGEQEDDPEKTRRVPRSARRLDRAERTGAWAIGLALEGAGGTAVYLSDNQAGTATLLVIGGLFVLLGIQGTPLVRASSGDHTVELAENVAGQAREIAEQSDLSDAQQFVAGAVVGRPTLLQDRSIVRLGSQLWELGCKSALERILLKLAGESPRLGRIELLRNERDYGVDATIVQDGRVIEVELKYLQRPTVATSYLRTLLQKRGVARRAAPLMLIINTPLSTAASRVIDEYPSGSVFTALWRDSEDDADLDRSVRAALSSLS